MRQTSRIPRYLSNSEFHSTRNHYHPYLAQRLSVNSTSREVHWIRDVSQFAVFMGNIPKTQRSEIPPIKIAIIDDGVDASLDILLEKVVGGKSFYPYVNSSNLLNAYYVPSGQHGTMMADLICRICPSCLLYVARLDERPSRLDLSRQITTKSAADASFLTYPLPLSTEDIG